MVVSAGCAGVTGEANQQPPQPVRLEEVYVNNEDSDARAVDVVIQRNETVAYWDTLHLEGVDGTDGDTRVSAGETVEPGAFGESPGRYVLLVRLGNRTTGERFDVNDVAGGCEAVSLQVEIRDGGEVALLREGSCS